MLRNKMMLLAGVLTLSAGLSARPAAATPTDGAFPWSMGGLKVAGITQGGDNEVYVNFRNPDGSIRTVWPNSSGTDLCGGKDILRLARARTNFKEIVDALSGAGLAGRPVWVAYEPTAGTCYIKSVNVTMQ